MGNVVARLFSQVDGLAPDGMPEVFESSVVGSSGRPAPVAMVKPADFGYRDDPAQARRFDGSSLIAHSREAVFSSGEPRWLYTWSRSSGTSQRGVENHDSNDISLQTCKAMDLGASLSRLGSHVGAWGRRSRLCPNPAAGKTCAARRGRPEPTSPAARCQSPPAGDRDHGRRNRRPLFDDPLPAVRERVGGRRSDPQQFQVSLAGADLERRRVDQRSTRHVRQGL